MLAGVERWRDRTFLVQGSRRITTGEFFAAVAGARERLRALGVQPGDRVMLLGHNSPDWVLGLWASWSLGAVPVLGNLDDAASLARIGSLADRVLHLTAEGIRA